MGKYVVTQEQWERVMGNNPSEVNGGKLPVTNVSWNECQEFIKKLNEKTRIGFRLPTEAEWEYACRAGTSTAYSFGNNITADDANYEESKIDKPVIVGSYKANAYGLYDLHGNVFEWCEDWYGEYPKGSVSDPKGIGSKQYRVLRGGSFAGGAGAARSCNRDSAPPDRQDVYDWDHGSNGFRLVMTIGLELVSHAEEINPVTSTAKALNIGVEDSFAEGKTKEVEESLAKKFNKTANTKEDLGDGVTLEMVLIPSGRFVMGSPEGEKGRYNGEVQHEVTITKAFYMGKHEVTQGQWERVMGNNLNRNEEEDPRLPVTNISWNDCQDFIKKLNKKLNGKTTDGYRLPTEAEWEYACRAGATTAYSFGSRITPKDANYSDSKIGESVAVGSYKSNAFGLNDMHGNVWEWCEDRYCDYLTEAVTDPKGSSGERRVLRGGSFGCVAWSTRSAFRDGYAPSGRDVSIGFRLARTL